MSLVSCGLVFPEILSSAVLVVAHPDDEILWFSSVLARVRRCIVCYEDCDDGAKLGPGRRGVASSYPLSTMHWLRLPEPCSYKKANF